ncbi:MAG TPA: HAD family hydrolase [Nocardioidaceae bacterium]|nr:HAD family hydrolase [Nocardioidaceae bacterium]
MIATDLDGTLLRSDGSISARTRDALALAERAGSQVIFVSGRPPRWLDELADAIGAHGLAICANGALVYDVADREVVEQHGLPGEAALQVARALREAVPGVVFAVERRLEFGREPVFMEHWPLPDGAIEAELEELLVDPVAKLIARHDDLDADEFKSRAAEVVGSMAEATHSSPSAMLEISAAGVSKATTLAQLCAERDVEPEQVLAFGDMPNDVPMLSWAGTSYAVANAHPDAVEVADHRCGSNDEDGVAEVLERVFG